MQFAEEKATVSHVDDNFVFLETKNRASCSNCTNKSGCGKINTMFTLRAKSKLKIKNNNALILNKGDSVVVEIEPKKILLATSLMYMSPLLLLFFCSTLAKLYFGETASILAGLSGLFIGLLFVRQFAKQSTIAEYFQPRLVRKIINIDQA